MVLHQDKDEDDLGAFLDGSHELLREQVGAVADHHEDVAVQPVHPGTEATGDLVSHA